MTVTITIRNIPITFPFEPYDVQKKYMEKVIECLENGTHGMLESPTGTGKTLSLLCSSLAWLTAKIEEIDSSDNIVKKTTDEKSLPDGDNQGGPPAKENIPMQRPKIIYSSRTHTQLTQAIAELRRTHYAYVNTAVLGSRDQLCVNSDISQESNPGVKISKCRAAVKKKSCLYQLNVERTKNDPVLHEEILDIEDLVRVGQKLTTCPYYMTRDLKERADIVFMPYNYLLDMFTRKRLEINLKNCVVILDEGHNIEKMCEESASFELSWTDITTCVEELAQIIDALPKIQEYAPEPPPFSVQDVAYLKKVMSALRTSVDNIALRSSDNSGRFCGDFIFELLGKSQINHQNFVFLDRLMGSIVEWINTSDASGLQHFGAGLDKFQHCLQIVFNIGNCSIVEHRKLVSESYKVYVTLESKSHRRLDSRFIKDDKPVKLDAKVVNFWCFNPAFGMRALSNEGIRSIIITSGSLSPLEPLISELGIPMDVTLESGHVVTKEQFFVGVLQAGPDKHLLNSSFKTRNDPSYLQSLGRTIQNVARLIPHGLLVFFPSYAVMDKCLDAWESCGLWDAINRTKEICIEPRNKRELKEVMNRYYAKIAEPGSKGACFFAVLRGKVSEGLDFIDHNGRGVIVTGLPYPPWKDPRVELKREYLTENKKRVSADQWYQLEATRAVNQAIGRVIRHRNDYGVILLCDTRFSWPGIQKNLSCWLRKEVKIVDGFPQLPRPLAVFFKNAKEKMPQPEIKPLTAECSDDSDDDISVITSESPSEYMGMRYSGRFSQRYEQNYLRSKFAWLDKRRTARSAAANRYRNEIFNSRIPAVTASSVNMPTERIPKQSFAKNKPFRESPLMDCCGDSRESESCGVPPSTVSASHSGNTGREKYTVSIAKPSTNALPYSRGEKPVPTQESTSVIKPSKTYGKAPKASTRSATSVRSVNLPAQELSSAAVAQTVNSGVYYVDMTGNQYASGNLILVEAPDGGQMRAENVQVVMADPVSSSTGFNVITDASGSDTAVPDMLPENVVKTDSIVSSTSLNVIADTSVNERAIPNEQYALALPQESDNDKQRRDALFIA